MTTPATRRAEADARHDLARWLYRLGDAIQAGRCRPWQITAAAPLVQTLSRLLTGRREGEK